MRTTKERLITSYCRPNLKEWKELRHSFTRHRNWISRRNRGEICYFESDPEFIGDAKESEFHSGDKTLIPTEHFLDLMTDRIAPWRLIEDGFFAYQKTKNDTQLFSLNNMTNVYITGDVVTLYIEGEEPIPVKTYTELINLLINK